MEKHPLQKLFEHAGIEMRSYSGRCMYGERCLAVETDSLGDLLSKMFTAAYEMGKEHEYTPTLDSDEVFKIEQVLKSYRQDSMGLGTVIYWPGVKYIAADDDEEDTE